MPLPFLELISSTPPWSEDHRLLASVVLSPRSTRPLGLRLVGSLQWRDLADVAASPRVAAAVKVRAEALLKDQLTELRLGEDHARQDGDATRADAAPRRYRSEGDRGRAHQPASARRGPADAGARGYSQPSAARRDRGLFALERTLRHPSRHRSASADAGRARARAAQRPDHEGSPRASRRHPTSHRSSSSRPLASPRPAESRASRPEKPPNHGSSGG